MKKEKIINIIANEYNQYSLAQAFWYTKGNRNEARECQTAKEALVEVLSNLGLTDRYELVKVSETVSETNVRWYKMVMN